MQTIAQHIENKLKVLRKLQNAQNKLKSLIYCSLYFLSVGDEQNFYLIEQKINSVKNFIAETTEKYKKYFN